MAKKAWNVYYIDKDGEQIDQTQIDEKSAKLAWELFEEFGHKKTKGNRIEWEKTTEDK